MLYEHQQLKRNQIKKKMFNSFAKTIMRNSYLQDVAKKIIKKRWKLIYSDEIKKIIKQYMKDEYTDKKAYKLIYYLKNRWYIISLKKNIFYVKLPEEHLADHLILMDHYRQILHSHVRQKTDNKRYIWWIKWLELHYSNLDVPDDILIVNSTKQAKEVIVATKSVHFKRYTSKKTDLFIKFKKFTTKTKMWKYSYPIASKELALMECMYNFDEMFDRYTYETVKKVIKRSKHLDIDCINSIIKLWKHHTSINRLHKLAKDVNKTFAKQLNESIKRYSFFLDV